MNGTEVVTDERLLVSIDTGRTVELHRQSLRFPATQDRPPLAVERLRRSPGATRPPVILVHGFAQNRFTWQVTGRSLAGRLAEAGYDVLNLELRGHGNSRAYGAGNARSFAEYVDDLVRVVRACARTPFVIGHSLGGGVCVGAATEVDLAGVVHIAGIYSFASRNPLIRLAARVSLQLAPLLTASQVRMSTGWAGRLVGRLYSVSDIAGFGFPISGWAPGSMERDLLEERLRLGFDWTSVEVWLEMCRWAQGAPFPYAAAFARRDVPLLVVSGNADPLLHSDDARRCYEGSGSADRQFVEFEPFEHEGHWGHVDLLLGHRAPRFVWPTVVGWLDARSAG
jgi:alpha-beta hydrolase superfamily lysophospholipase